MNGRTETMNMTRAMVNGCEGSRAWNRGRVVGLLSVAGACLALAVSPCAAQEEKKQPEAAPKSPAPTKQAPTQPGFKPNPGVPNTPQPVPAAPAEGLKGGATTGKAPSGPAGAQPGESALPPLPVPEPDADHWVINAPGELSLADLIRLVQRDMGLQIVFADAGVQDQKVVLTAPLKIRKEQMLDFIARLLETKGYTIFSDEIGLYTVTPTAGGAPVGNGVSRMDPYSATQIITTKGIKPSSISTLIPALGSGGAGGQIVALDEFGVIMVTDTAARTKLIRDFIEQLVKLRGDTRITPIDVKYVSAATARDRILSLTGEGGGSSSGLTQTPGGVTNKPGNVPVPGNITGGAGSSTSNLAAQLTVSPFSNALFFKGREEELPHVQQLLALVDVENRMESKFYEIGMRAAEVISAMGTREGLGEVTIQEVSEDTGSNSPFGSAGSSRLNQQGLGQPAGLLGGQQQTQALAGSGFVIFPEPGGFMYYGTKEQHARVNDLIEKNKLLTTGEQIVYQFYKLKNTKAADIADIVTSLVNNEQPAGNSGSIIGPDLGRGSSNRNRRGSSNRNGRQDQDQLNQPNQNRNNSSSTSGAGIGGIEAGEDTFVMADEKQNQVIIKTKRILQPEFAKLINKLDARRPQVYIQAQIIAVTGTEDFRLAFEQQWFAGQFGVNTNFGLSSAGTNFLSRRNVATSLPGLTAAIIQSDKVPLIITALQNNTEGRVLATPQLLVDDNEPATVTSDLIVQTQVTTTIDSQPQVSVGEPVSAGTELTVTPQISENAVKLEVYVRQSAFTGSGSSTLPPDKLENVIDTGSVTVPRDSTIVIGGLSTENIGKTVIKVPLLGDIPLIGHLFRDTTTSTDRTTLYVFLTPRVMRDPNFTDIRLLSEGPAREAKITSEFLIPGPELMSSPIEMPRVLPDVVVPGPGANGAGANGNGEGAGDGAKAQRPPVIPPPEPIGAELEGKKP